MQYDELTADQKEKVFGGPWTTGPRGYDCPVGDMTVPEYRIVPETFTRVMGAKFTDKKLDYANEFLFCGRKK